MVASNLIKESGPRLNADPKRIVGLTPNETARIGINNQGIKKVGNPGVSPNDADRGVVAGQPGAFTPPQALAFLKMVVVKYEAPTAAGVR